MPSGGGSKRFLVIGLILFAALFIFGFATGAIGAGFTQSEEDKASGEKAAGPFIRVPEVHLPAQPIFPNRERERYLEFLGAEAKEEEQGGGALTHHEHELVDDGAFGSGFKFIVTNTLLSSWIASVVLVLLFAIGTRKARLVPGRLQNFCEIIIDGLLNFVEGVIGKERGRLVFPVIATIFLFVLFNAWIGLLPIYPALGWIEDDRLLIHLLRPAGTDLNMPLALALISFLFVELLGLRLLGMRYVGKFVRVGSLRRGLKGMIRFRPMEAFQGLLDFFFVGPLEAFSELVRIISFTFRLFGNMTAGEILVLVSAFLVPFVATIGVYGLELLVGFVQALIFAGLTLVFVTIALTPHGEEEH